MVPRMAMRAIRTAKLLVLLLPVLSIGCQKSGCPTKSPSDARATWEADLDKKT